MGTYHSTNKVDAQWEATGNPNGGRTLKREGVRALLDYSLANPKKGLNRIAVEHGTGGSTVNTWLRAPVYLRVNQYVAEWLREGDHLERWLLTRPRNALGPRLLEAVGTVQQAAPGPEPIDAGNERLIGPTGIGAFVPVATDDLLVLKEEALKVKAEAEAVVTEASVLAIAIDTVRDWLTDKDKLQQALGRVQALESQLRATDDTIKRFQQQKLASNHVVHSND